MKNASSLPPPSALKKNKSAFNQSKLAFPFQSSFKVTKTKCKKKKVAKSIWSDLESELADVMAQKAKDIEQQE